MQAVGRSFQNLWTVAVHELQIYFLSPIIYLIGAIWLLIAGGFFVLNLLQYAGATAGLGGAGDPTLSVTLGAMSFLLMFMAPAFTMRLLSEEVRAGTHELLFTAPIRDWEIVVGKWLGSWMAMSILIIITFVYPLIFFLSGNPDPGMIFAGYIGFWLWTGATLAVGVLTSSLTQHQLVALFLGVFITLFLWLGTLLGRIITNPEFSDFFTQITAQTHLYDNMFNRGVIDPVDIVYFLGIMAICLFIGTQVLSTRRYRS